MRGRKQIAISFEGEEGNLVDMLDEYRVAMGWTWKRLMLVGLAEAIAKQGDNPDLVVEVVNYLGSKR